MTVKIEFLKNNVESTFPIIRLTKSKNKITGTATFIFIEPLLFKLSKINLNFFNSMTLIWANQQIKTKDIQIFFYKGKPFLIKSIFIFKNSKEWFHFLNFLQFYAKEIGLSFSEIN